MTKFFRYFTRGLAIVNLITMKLPLYMADGKISVDEMVELVKSVLEIGGWKATIDLSEDLKGKTANFALEQ